MFGDGREGDCRVSSSLSFLSPHGQPRSSLALEVHCAHLRVICVKASRRCKCYVGVMGPWCRGEGLLFISTPMFGGMFPLFPNICAKSFLYPR